MTWYTIHNTISVTLWPGMPCKTPKLAPLLRGLCLLSTRRKDQPLPFHPRVVPVLSLLFKAHSIHQFRCRVWVSIANEVLSHRRWKLCRFMTWVWNVNSFICLFISVHLSFLFTYMFCLSVYTYILLMLLASLLLILPSLLLLLLMLFMSLSISLTLNQLGYHYRN